MSTRTHDALQAILIKDDFEDLLSPDERDEIESLERMFTPYNGDPPEEARNRTGIIAASCQNCGHTWAAAFLPAEVSRVATTVLRACICPRCFANEGILAGGAA